MSPQARYGIRAVRAQRAAYGQDYAGKRPPGAVGSHRGVPPSQGTLSCGPELWATPPLPLGVLPDHGGEFLLAGASDSLRLLARLVHLAKYTQCACSARAVLRAVPQQ